MSFLNGVPFPLLPIALAASVTGWFRGEFCRSSSIIISSPSARYFLHSLHRHLPLDKLAATPESAALNLRNLDTKHYLPLSRNRLPAFIAAALRWTSYSAAALLRSRSILRDLRTNLPYASVQPPLYITAGNGLCIR